MEEMPACLRELFEQASSEQRERFANNARSSAKPSKSILTFNGTDLPPLLVRFILLNVIQRVDFR